MPWPWLANVRDGSGTHVELMWAVAQDGRWSAVNTTNLTLYFDHSDGVVGTAAPGETILGPGRPDITQI